MWCALCCVHVCVPSSPAAKYRIIYRFCRIAISKRFRCDIERYIETFDAISNPSLLRCNAKTLQLVTDFAMLLRPAGLQKQELCTVSKVKTPPHGIDTHLVISKPSLTLAFWGPATSTPWACNLTSPCRGPSSSRFRRFHLVVLSSTTIFLSKIYITNSHSNGQVMARKKLRKSHLRRFYLVVLTSTRTSVW